MKPLPRTAPTACHPAPIDHAVLAIRMISDLTSVLRLGYCLPEAEFAALLDCVYKEVTRTVLERLPR